MQIGLFAFSIALATLTAAISLPVHAPAWAQQVLPDEITDRYQLGRTQTGFIRLDRQTGAVSYCREETGGLTCRLAADERTAFEQELDMLAKRVDTLEKRLDGRTAEPGLPGDEEVEEALSIMERFMRRFMSIIGEFQSGSEPAPDRT